MPTIDINMELAETRIDELGIHRRVKAFIERRLNVATIGEFFEKVKTFSDLKPALSRYSDINLLEKFLEELALRNLRIADCPKDVYPDIALYISEKTPKYIDIAPFGSSEEFVEFLRNKGCTTMADVLNLNSNEFVILNGEMRNAAIQYLRKMDESRGWRLVDAPISSYPDIDVFIGERFWIFLSEMPFSTRIKNSFDKHELDTSSQLVRLSRQELLTSKVVGENALEEVVEVLHQYRLHLKGDSFSTCKKCHTGIVVPASNQQLQYCAVCEAKKKRTSKMKDVIVTITGPDYGSYTNLPSGFTLFANIENKTDALKQIRLVDFYIFSEGRQRAPHYYLTGYSFDNERIFAYTSRTVGKIFSTQGLKDNKLAEGDYAIITLETQSNQYKMYKFVYLGWIFNKWEIDDYTEYTQ